MQCGQVMVAKWNARPVECPQCGKTMLASSLGGPLADVHDIYQLQMVTEELLEQRPLAN
jgi:ribosomal protein S27E